MLRKTKKRNDGLSHTWDHEDPDLIGCEIRLSARSDK
jgi:hypothetical protein